MVRHLKHFINGEFIEGKLDEYVSNSPIDDKPFCRFLKPSNGQIEDAIKSAHAGFKLWSKFDFSKRCEIIKNFAKIIGENKKELAQIISQDTGKQLWDAEGEVASVIGKIDISIKSYTDRTGSHSHELSDMKLDITHRAHGIMLVLGPYNFPAHLPNGQIVPALLAGNSVILKPSEQASAASDIIANCWQKAGLPDGVLNVLYGAGAEGATLVNHDQIDGILFTGGIKAGRAIHKAVAGKVEKIVALELGGNNPLIAWNLADIDKAAETIFFSSYISTGQRCTCSRRLIIPNGAYGNELIDRLIKLSEKMRIGKPFDEPKNFMGPLISASARDQFFEAYNFMVENGGEEIIKPQKLDELGKAYLSPALIDVTHAKNLKDEEVFGPLLQCIRVDNFEHALEVANNTRFGLSAALLSDDAQLFENFHSSIRAGIINWNRPTAGASSLAPFGGVGLSGNHRPAGAYAADFSAYPVASLKAPKLAVSLIGIN